MPIESLRQMWKAIALTQLACSLRGDAQSCRSDPYLLEVYLFAVCIQLVPVMCCLKLYSSLHPVRIAEGLGKPASHFDC